MTGLTYSSITNSITVTDTRPLTTPPRVLDLDGKQYLLEWPPDHTADLPNVDDLAFIFMTPGIAAALHDAALETHHPSHATALHNYYQHAVDRGDAYLTRTTPALRHALQSAHGHPHQYAHPAARWHWEPDAPFLTCSYCGSVHPAAIAQLAPLDPTVTLIANTTAPSSGVDAIRIHPPTGALPGDPGSLLLTTDHLADLPVERLARLLDHVTSLYGASPRRLPDGRVIFPLATLGFNFRTEATT